MRLIIRQQYISADDIDEVTLSVTPGAARGNLAFPFEAGDSQQKALFSMRYSLANVLLRKEARIEALLQAKIKASEMSKVFNMNIDKPLKIIENVSETYFARDLASNYVEKNQNIRG